MTLKFKTHVLFDIDHTLIDASGRDHLIPECMRTGQWDDYHYAGRNDPPALDAIRLYRIFREQGYTCIGITARPGKFREQTEDHLSELNISFNALLMRPIDNGFQPSPEIKLTLAREYFAGKIKENVLFIIDDREDVAEAFVKEGVTSLQIHGRNYK